ncbi:MAG: FMN-binding protein, partial [Oscillospiraceae bacterium]|nr:FMN-binding protein [Oscillospiraceae bacterium]
MENKKLLNVVALAIAAVLLVVLVSGHVQQNKSQIFEMPEGAQEITASADGRNGPVEVNLIASQDALYRLKVVNHGETEGIGTLAVDQLPSAILEAQSVDVDAIAGATLTSNAIKNAVVNALEVGGFDASVFGADAVKAAAAPAAKPAAVSSAGGSYVPGTYTAQATGMGTVVVTVTVDESSITEVVLDTSGETPEIGGAANETLTAQVMEAQSAEIDGVAGASLTSTAVRTAVADALSQAADSSTEAVSSAGGSYVPGTYTAQATGMGTVV